MIDLIAALKKSLADASADAFPVPYHMHIYGFSGNNRYSSGKLLSAADLEETLDEVSDKLGLCFITADPKFRQGAPVAKRPDFGCLPGALLLLSRKLSLMMDQGSLKRFSWVLVNLAIV